MQAADRELLKSAAQAGGYHTTEWADPGELLSDKGGWVQFIGHGRVLIFNSLTDDGDALRLAVKLGLCIEFGYCEDDAPVVYCGPQHERGPMTANFPDSNAATRRAITCAAAAMAEAPAVGAA